MRWKCKKMGREKGSELSCADASVTLSQTMVPIHHTNTTLLVLLGLEGTCVLWIQGRRG